MPICPMSWTTWIRTPATRSKAVSGKGVRPQTFIVIAAHCGYRGNRFQFYENTRAANVPAVDNVVAPLQKRLRFMPEKPVSVGYETYANHDALQMECDFCFAIEIPCAEPLLGYIRLPLCSLPLSLTPETACYNNPTHP